MATRSKGSQRRQPSISSPRPTRPRIPRKRRGSAPTPRARGQPPATPRPPSQSGGRWKTTPRAGKPPSLPSCSASSRRRRRSRRPKNGGGGRYTPQRVGLRPLVGGERPWNRAVVDDGAGEGGAVGWETERELQR